MKMLRFIIFTLAGGIGTIVLLLFLKCRFLGECVPYPNPASQRVEAPQCNFLSERDRLTGYRCERLQRLRRGER